MALFVCFLRAEEAASVGQLSSGDEEGGQASDGVLCAAAGVAAGAPGSGPAPAQAAAARQAQHQ